MKNLSVRTFGQPAKRNVFLVGFFMFIAIPLPALAADSLYDYCTQNPSRAAQFDCECAAAMEPEIRDSMSDQVVESKLGSIANYERSIERTQDKLAKETDPDRKQRYEGMILKYEDQIARSKVRPDPASHKVSSLMTYFTNTNECRNYEGMKAQTYDSCMSYLKADDESQKSALCECEAEAVAEQWVNSSPAVTAKTSSISNIQVSARYACGKS